MADLMKHITDKTNGLSYTLHGDYYYPDLTVPEEPKPIGKYGLLRNAISMTGIMLRFFKKRKAKTELICLLMGSMLR